MTIRSILLLLLLPIAGLAQTPTPTPPLSPSRVEITTAQGQQINLRPGEKAQAMAAAFDANNQTIPLPPHTFMPTDGMRAVIPSCVQVSTTGLITGLEVTPFPPGAVARCGVTVITSNNHGTVSYPLTPITVTILPPAYNVFLDPLGRAIAVNGLTWTREPFTVLSPLNLGADKRTRIVVYVSNLLPADLTTLTAELSQGTTTVSAVVEHASQVPNAPNIYQVVVRMPDSPPTGQVKLTVIGSQGRSSAGPVLIQ